MKTFAVINQKGGVAKTTSTFNIATALASAGKVVLMVDLDPQASLTISAGLAPEDYPENVSAVFQKKPKTAEYCISVESTVAKTEDRLFIMPADINLADTEMTIFTRPSREKFLKKALEQVAPIFDYCIIDCPPNLGCLTMNAMVAADELIIPTKSEYLSYRGLSLLGDTIEEIKDDLNPDLKIRGVIVSMYQKVIKDQRDMLAMIEENYNVLGVVKLAADTNKGITDGLPVIFAYPASDVSKAYDEIAKKLI